MSSRRYRDITVSSGRTLPHPTINYATLRADLSVRVIVNDDDDPDELTRIMQDYVDDLSLKHIKRMILAAKLEERDG